MGVSVYFTTVLFSKRVISDYEDKITAIGHKIQDNSTNFQQGEVNIFQAHEIEKNLVEERLRLEEKLQAQKLILEATEKAAHENAKKEFAVTTA